MRSLLHGHGWCVLLPGFLVVDARMGMDSVVCV